MRCQNDDRMQMIGHDLRLIQPRMREMVRDRTPAFIYNAACVVQIHPSIRSSSYNTPERFLPLHGTQRHEKRTLGVVTARQANVFVEMWGHWGS